MGDKSGPLKRPRLPLNVKKIQTGPSLTGRMIGLIGLAVVCALFFGFFALLRYGDNFLPPENVSREIIVDIPPGATAAQVAEILHKAGVIRSTDAFMKAIKIRGYIKKNTGLKAGEHVLNPSLSVWENLSLLVKGNFKVYNITVPEGRSMREIGKSLEDAGLANASEFLALCRNHEFISSLGFHAESLEGFLFPETYAFTKNTQVKDIIKAMTNQFWKVWKKYDALAAKKGLSVNEVATLASIVEKETASPKERPIIAQVFFNRLKRKMRLQTDPTVIYGIENFDGNLTKAHLETHHPYNTYLIAGLPPGPIANPGEEAIKAVLNPSPGQYLYFVSKNDGTHHFSETLAEHNRMVNRYQKAQRGS
ncbi:MAG: endolytic transglycosylase MltG [Deltaproteobacteria bacterium]|jgi:UPF0755 protein|nr:endolytic transglycosylase MltG [Deltaproteobacteria bacterium]